MIKYYVLTCSRVSSKNLKTKDNCKIYVKEARKIDRLLRRKTKYTIVKSI